MFVKTTVSPQEFPHPGLTQLVEMEISTEMIEGYAIQHIVDAEGQRPFIAAMRAYGWLTFGNTSPTSILSSEEMVRSVLAGVRPSHIRWEDAKKIKFRFCNGLWSTSLAIDDGWVVMLNENNPTNPRLNGCYKMPPGMQR